MESTNVATVEELRRRVRAAYEAYLTAEKELSALEEDRFRVCIFGSARIGPQDPTYGMVRKLAATMAGLGIDIVTGGGPGLMEAANQGEKDAKAKGTLSIGLPILLPNKKEPSNSHLDIKDEHSRFSSRLDEFMRLSHTVIVAPGGIGTLLELMYTWQLIQVDLLEPRPFVLLGRQFWQGLIRWMCAQQVRRGFVDPGDMDFVHLADTQAEVLEKIIPALDKFRADKRQIGHHPVADEAGMILEHAEKEKEAPAHQEKLPGTEV